MVALMFFRQEANGVECYCSAHRDKVLEWASRQHWNQIFHAKDPKRILKYPSFLNGQLREMEREKTAAALLYCAVLMLLLVEKDRNRIPTIILCMFVINNIISPQEETNQWPTK